MSILEEVLMEEYERSLRVSRTLEEDNLSLPRGYIRKRNIRGREYYYLQYRDGTHVKSNYIKADQVEEMQKALSRRKENDAALKEQARSRKQIEKALGKDYIHEHSRT